jgi:hypothetical protein
MWWQGVEGCPTQSWTEARRDDAKAGPAPQEDTGVAQRGVREQSRAHKGL